MQLSGASFILRMKSRVLLRSKVGIIMVSICLHGVISWSQASGRGRFGPTKTVITEKYHPSVFKFCLTWTVYYISNKMTKFYDDVYSFEPVGGCQFLKLYISMFEKRLESPQWLLAVSKPKVRMRVTSAWGQELPDYYQVVSHFARHAMWFICMGILKIVNCECWNTQPFHHFQVGPDIKLDLWSHII